MSSARNHAKRSHRSEHFKQAAFNAGTRKVLIAKPMQAKRANFFSKLMRVIKRKSAEA